MGWIGLSIVLFTFGRENAYCDDIYFARYQIQSENGMIVKSVLEMIPVSEEFRMEGFQRVRVRGMARGSHEIDAESAAIHDAVSKILVGSGLKSINSRRHMVHSGAGIGSGDVAILNFEGVVRFPVLVQSRKAVMENDLYIVDAEIDFAPIAFPTRWSALYIDHLLKKTAQEIRMFLHSAFLR
ncbi:MAG: hypothetical protein C4522_15270 [Desulfobacteraceae bacterium]|nr:MAG: hypothetical protein C4522_15270 [Desulfobacteraceae bacterium]